MMKTLDIKSRKPKTLIVVTAKYVVQFVLWMISLQVMQLYLWTRKICPQRLCVANRFYHLFFLTFLTLKYGAETPYWMFTWYFNPIALSIQFSMHWFEETFAYLCLLMRCDKIFLLIFRKGYEFLCFSICIMHPPT